MRNLYVCIFFLVLVISPEKNYSEKDDFESLCAFRYINPIPIKPSILPRRDYDQNEALLSQYDKVLGEKIGYEILGKMRYRVVGDISYLDAFGLCKDGLYLVYKGGEIIIHHTEFDYDGDICEQVLFIRDGQIIAKEYHFSDIAYHFAIGADNAIAECKPLSHMGTHAGNLKECKEKWRLVKNLPKEIDQEFWEKFDKLVKLLRIDPDFGAIGEVAVGNFEKYPPSQEIYIALMDLTIWNMWRFDIPIENVKFHREVREEMLEKGYTPTGKPKPKSCPGKWFVDEECFREMVMERMRELHYIADWY